MKPRVIREAPGAWVVTSSASRYVCGTWTMALAAALNVARQHAYEVDMSTRRP